MKDRRRDTRPGRRTPQPPAAPAAKRPQPAAPAGKRVTVARALSKRGHCSRTQAEALVREGRVSIGGRTVTDLETWVDVDSARIEVDGKPVMAQDRVYLMLNKPRGLVTTRHDPEGRATVYDCLGDLAGQHMSPVGRLDKASEGLLLFTNDTGFANALLDPATHVAKTYHVQIDRLADDAMLSALRAGIEHDGDCLRAERVTLLRAGERHSWLEFVLTEGKNRQIRRMLESLGLECLRLVRVAIGGLLLGDLEKGTARALTAAEVEALRRLAHMA